MRGGGQKRFFHFGKPFTSAPYVPFGFSSSSSSYSCLSLSRAPPRPGIKLSVRSSGLEGEIEGSLGRETLMRTFRYEKTIRRRLAGLQQAPFVLYIYNVIVSFHAKIYYYYLYIALSTILYSMYLMEIIYLFFLYINVKIITINNSCV